MSRGCPTRTETLKTGAPIDVVVITFNRLLYLKECIGSLAANTRYPHRIIVVDDGSEDGTREWLEKNRKRLGLHVVLNKHNVGSATARMIGLAETQSGVVAISDDDAWYRPGWLEECVRVLKAYPKAAIVSAHNPGEPHSRNVIGEDVKKGISIHFRTAITPMHWVFDKRIVVQAGGFTLPKGRVMGYSGTPLCSKIRQAGYQIIRSRRQCEGPDGRDHPLVSPMDTNWSPMNHRPYYNKTGYNGWRRLAKKGRAKKFTPRAVGK